MLTFIALVEYAVVNVRIREDAEKAQKAKKEKEEDFNLQTAEEVAGLDEMTLWLMG